jgi:hypothetical protein
MRPIRSLVLQAKSNPNFLSLTPGILQPKVIDEDVTLAGTFLSSPDTIEAAIGWLIVRKTFKPQIWSAAFVA